MDERGPRLAYFARILCALPIIARRGVYRTTVRVDVHGFEVRLSNSIVVGGYHAVIFRSEGRVASVVVDVSGVQDRLGRLIRVTLCRFVIHDFRNALLSQANFRVVLFFRLLMFRLLVASRDAIRVGQRRVVFCGGDLVRVFGNAYGVLRRVGIR